MIVLRFRILVEPNAIGGRGREIAIISAIRWSLSGNAKYTKSINICSTHLLLRLKPISNRESLCFLDLNERTSSIIASVYVHCKLSSGDRESVGKIKINYLHF